MLDDIPGNFGERYQREIVDRLTPGEITAVWPVWRNGDDALLRCRVPLKDKPKLVQHAATDTDPSVRARVAIYAQLIGREITRQEAT